MKLFRTLLCAALAVCTAQFVVADDISLTPEEAGPEYKVQGEYTGKVKVDGQDVKFGVQVIALGNNEYDAVAYPGGLPGDGWDGATKIRAKGKTENGQTKLTASDNHGYGLITDGKLELHSESGEKVATLDKVERKSPTLGAKPAEGAIVLFDGTSADKFANGKITMKDLLAADCETKDKFGDHTLHIEFRTPFRPKARGQERGNSGVYVQGRYECQVLDSFGLEGENNECGGIYSISKPKVNACFPPLSWQTYDVEFKAAVFEGDKKVKNARVTIRQNGILIHDNLELTHGTPGKNPEAPGPDVIYLQGHGNPVVYRNIWVVKK